MVSTTKAASATSSTATNCTSLLPAPLVGEQVLGGAVAVAVDHLPRSIQHVLGGAVILLQQDLLAAWGSQFSKRSTLR